MARASRVERENRKTGERSIGIDPRKPGAASEQDGAVRFPVGAPFADLVAARGNRDPERPPVIAEGHPHLCLGLPGPMHGDMGCGECQRECPLPLDGAVEFVRRDGDRATRGNADPRHDDKAQARDQERDEQATEEEPGWVESHVHALTVDRSAHATRRCDVKLLPNTAVVPLQAPSDQVDKGSGGAYSVRTLSVQGAQS